MRESLARPSAMLILAALVVFLSGCSRSEVERADIHSAKPAAPMAPQVAEEPAATLVKMTPSELDEARGAVTAFCADCHAMPRPASSPRGEWLGEIEQGFSLYEYSGRTDLQVPDKEMVVRFFESQSPDELTIPTAVRNLPEAEIPIRSDALTTDSTRAPGITNVKQIDLGLRDRPALVVCDINTGAVTAMWPGIELEPLKLATLLQPVHCEPADLDQDGLVDLLVADIGEFNANDSDLGRVVWLRRVSTESEKYEAHVIAEGLSRVSEARAADVDNDGDPDVLIAAFGWRNSGQILLLENEGLDDKHQPRFKSRVVDDRHGAINVPILDLDHDGDLDFIALISQEHELVDAFINDGTGNFSPQNIYRAPDPAYGSSGIQLVDMDGDADVDVLFTNGDSFDRGYKPHHSIQWLENKGVFPYEHHHISQLPGVLNAKASDLDGDGDVDIVACSLLAGGIVREMATSGVASVLMLRQVAPGEFAASSIENGLYDHISLEVADFNSDGKPDIAVGNFLRSGPAERPAVNVYWNQRP